MKEPHFFLTDSPGYRRVTSIKEYERLYSGCEEKWLGDASVWYLHSATAIREIAAYSKEARFIVMLRRPHDMIRSLITQLYASGREDVANINHAWAMSRRRRMGFDVPRNALEPRHLDYEAVAAFGTQLSRVYEVVPRDKVKIVLFDDFALDTAGVVRDVMGFLNVSDDVPPELPVINEATEPVWPLLSRFMMYPPWPLSAVKAALKRAPLIKHRSVMRGAYRRLSTPARKQEWTPETRDRIAECYAAEVAHLERLLGRNLDQWRK
jgi:hypothetical protein